MKAFITGGAGFIGRNLVPFLLNKNYSVVVYDRVPAENSPFHPKTILNKKFSYIQGDVLDGESLLQSMKGSSVVYHLSANADVRGGLTDNTLDLTQGTIATSKVLNAMKNNDVKDLIFPSSMTVYGKMDGKTVSENDGPCLPISLYGASKLASEALISAYCHNFGMKSWILRFANVVGPNLTHGVIYDLINKLRDNPKKLKVLGNGYQTKPYIYIDDLLNAIDVVFHNSKESINLFNLGVTTTISVREIVSCIIHKMNLEKVDVLYDKNPYGWTGDVPLFNLSINKLRELGFSPKHTSRQAVEKTIDSRLKEL